MDPVYFQVSKSCMIHMNNYAQASRFILDQRKIHSDSEQNLWLLLRLLQASRTLWLKNHITKCAGGTVVTGQEIKC